jgi:nucleotide-binding universal stress UspA family protein
MSDVFIVGFDGADASRRAAQLACGLAKHSNGRVHLVYVLEWSPYSFLTKEEVAERHKRREMELSRAAEIVKPVADELSASGVTVTHEVRYGHAGELLCEIAQKLNASQIFVGRRGSRSLADRLLGGLAISLVQAAPVAVTVVP